jgi:hypothetical protein
LLKVRYQGQTYVGEQIAIVDEVVFQQVQVALRKAAAGALRLVRRNPQRIGGGMAGSSG